VGWGLCVVASALKMCASLPFKGAWDEIYHLLHRSYAGILKMRRSIESVDARISASEKAILESRDLLKRVGRGALA